MGVYILQHSHGILEQHILKTRLYLERDPQKYGDRKQNKKFYKRRIKSSQSYQPSVLALNLFSN